MRAKLYISMLWVCLFLSNNFVYATESDGPKAGLLNVVLARINNAVQEVKACCATVDSKVDVVDDKADTIDSKVDVVQACCQTVYSTIDYFVVPELASIESKLDTWVGPLAETINSKVDVLDEKNDTINSKLDVASTELVSIESKLDTWIGPLAETIDSKVDVLDEKNDTINSKLDVANTELVSIESKLDVHVIPELELQASQLDIIESKIDEIIFDTDPLNSKLDVLDEKLDTVGSRLDEIETKIITIDSLVDKIDIDTSFCATINSKVDVLDEKVDTVGSKLDVANTELVSIESKLDVHVIPGLESQASQLDIIESKIDEIIFDTDPLNSKLDVLDEKLDTVGSRLDEVETKIITIDSLVDKIDIDTSFCATINSKVDVLDEKVDTVDSKVDLLLDDEACCQTVRSTIDYAVVPELVSIESKLDKWIGPLTEIIDSKIDKLSFASSCCQSEFIAAGDSISAPGSYKLSGNGTGQIQINASDVILDLCGFTLTNNAGVVIEIASNLTNIEIKNGKIKSDGSQNGIAVSSGCQLICIEDIKIFSCYDGIRFSGANGNEILDVEVKNCVCKSCNAGVYATYTKKMVFENCKALNCVIHGFDQNNSDFNVYKYCEVLGTANGFSDMSAFGFFSIGGRGNLFKECVAEGIQKTVASNFGAGSTGFFLGGVEGNMETETKIINCIANSTSLSADDTLATAYGIKLDPVILSYDNLLVRVAQESYTLGALSVNWSSDGKYLAVGGVAPANATIEVYSFSGSNLSSAPISSVEYGSSVKSVDWSPDGKYLAVGGDGYTTGHGDIEVYSFDGLDLSSTPIFKITDYSSEPSSSINSVDWSPDGKYLAVGGGVPSTGHGEIEVYSFYGSNLSSTPISYISGYGLRILSVNWSPDGKYLAVGGNVPSPGHGNIELYSFDGADLSPAPISPIAYGGSISSVSWSPDGKYLAVGGSTLELGHYEIEVYSFNGSALTLLPPINYGNTVLSVSWSPYSFAPDAIYLAVGGSGPSTPAHDGIEVYSFDGSNLEIKKALNYGNSVNSVNWSPDGRHLAVGGSTPELGHYEIEVYNVMDAPSRCLIDGNRVCNTGKGARGGIGILGTGKNSYIRNVAMDNDVNFNKAIYPRYGKDILGLAFADTTGIWDNLMISY